MVSGSGKSVVSKPSRAKVTRSWPARGSSLGVGRPARRMAGSAAEQAAQLVVPAPGLATPQAIRSSHAERPGSALGRKGRPRSRLGGDVGSGRGKRDAFFTRRDDLGGHAGASAGRAEAVGGGVRRSPYPDCCGHHAPAPEAGAGVGVPRRDPRWRPCLGSSSRAPPWCRCAPTGATERVARTQDLGHRIEAGTEDELGRLAAQLQHDACRARALAAGAAPTRLRRLARAAYAADQREANLDALAMGERLPARERARVIAAAQAQLQELAVLVAEFLVDLSKTETIRSIEAVSPGPSRSRGARTRAARCAAMPLGAGRRALPGARRTGTPGRAIADLLDNACKWNPPTAGTN